jgi:tripeptide aminopeptidase
VDDETTRNMIIIQGGERVNIVPEKVIVRGEVRSLVHEKMIREVRKTEKMAEKAAEDFGGRVKWVVEEEFRGFYIQKTADIVKLAAAAYEKTGIEPEYFSHTGASDANILNEKGIQSIVISIASYKCHTTGEYYKLSNLSLLAQSLGEMVRLAAFM